MAQGGAPRPTNPNTPYQRGGWPVGCTSAQPQTKAPPEGRGSRHQTGLPEGGCGNGSMPATTTPSRRVAQIAAPEGSTSPGAFCMEGVGLPARAPGSGSSADQPDPSEPDKPAASTGGPAVGFEEGIRFAVTRVMRVPPFCGTDRPSSPRSSPWVTYVGHNAELLPLLPATRDLVHEIDDTTTDRWA
jgi:hypothetical protein